MENRLEKDRRRWLLLDEVMKGEDVLFVGDSHVHVTGEIHKFEQLARYFDLPLKLIKRSTLEMVFENGAMIVFVPRPRIQSRVIGATFKLAMIDGAVSYWDREDIKATGAKTI